MLPQKQKLKEELQYTTDRASAAIDKCDAINWGNLAAVLTQLIAMIQLVMKLFTEPSPSPTPPPAPPVI